MLFLPPHHLSASQRTQRDLQAMPIPEIVDVVVVGGAQFPLRGSAAINESSLTCSHSSSLGGPAGCVVAGRLARADPNLQVLLLEAGANNHEGESRPRLRPRSTLITRLAQTRGSTGLESMSRTCRGFPRTTRQHSVSHRSLLHGADFRLTNLHQTPTPTTPPTSWTQVDRSVRS